MVRVYALTRSRAPTAVFAGILLCGPGAWRGSAAPRVSGICHGPDGRELIARLPPSIELALSVDDAARQRGARPGLALRALLDESGIWTRTAGAWKSLSATLKLEPDAAFDELLGRRAVFVLTGLNGSASAAEWALLSHVTPETERRIRLSLEPAPRGIHSGRPILALEHGAYELATSGGVGSAAGPSGSGRADEMILLAPAGEDGLFDQLLKVITGTGGGATVGALPEWARAGSLDAGDNFVWYRPACAGGQAAQYFAISASLTERGWSAACVSSPSMSLWNPDRAEALPAGIAAFGRDAIFSYAGPVPTPEELGAAEFAPILAMVWPSAPVKLLSKLGPTMLLGVYPESQGLDPRGRPRWAFSAAVRTSDVDATARDVDAYFTELVPGSAQTHPRAGSVAESHEPGAEKPRVPQSVDPRVPRSLERRPVPLAMDPGDASADVSLTWVFAPSEGPDEGGPRTGWCLASATVGAGPGDGAAQRLHHLEGMVGEFSAPPPDVAEPVHSSMVLRPSLLWLAVESTASSSPHVLRAMRWIDEIRSSASKRADGTVIGEIRIEMNTGELGR